MKGKIISEEIIKKFRTYLCEEEKARTQRKSISEMSEHLLNM